MDIQRMADLPPEQRPRERLAALGPGSLTDAEMLAILIGSGMRGANATVVAQRLLTRLGGIDAVSRASVADLERHPGIGTVSACRIVASLELRRRMSRATRARSVGEAEALADIVVPLLAERPVETLLAVTMTASLALTDVLTLADGGSHHGDPPPADILAAVLARGAAAFALAHNHPTGSTEVLPSDLSSTEAVASAARSCGIRFTGHLVVAGGRWAHIAAEEAP